MNNLQKLVCCVLFGVFLGTASAQSSLTEPEKGILRIKLEQDLVESMNTRMSTRGGVVRTGTVALDEVHRKVKAGTMTRMFPYAPKYEERMRKYGLHQWYEIRYDNNLTPAEAASLYKSVPGVKKVDMVKKMVLMDNSQLIKDAPAQRASDGYAPFNDPMLRQQWHYNNDGSMVGWEVGSDVNLYNAWKITAGSPDVIVAIIDGGVDYLHEDLAENIWINKAEQNGKDGVDDDGNGYIDDVYGWNFVRNTNIIYPHNHGTHVAGTVGAVNNNGIGVGGVAGGSGNRDGVKMMSCQIFDQINVNVDFAKSLVYAANSGAVIAQCSWGWNEPDYKEQAVLDAIDYFTAEAGNYEGSKMKGGLCIFASGNMGGDGDYYPSAYPPAVAVGAMCADYKVATYTNHGKYVDITAPGGSVEFDTRMGVYSTTPHDQYGYMDGTSMATPHVSGVAALILSKYGDKSFTSKDLRLQLESAVRDIYQYNPEWTGMFGAGFIDAELALQENKKIAPETIGTFNVFPSQQEAGIEWIIPNDADDHKVHHHTIYWNDKAFTSGSDLTTLRSLNIDTKFKTSGTTMLEEVGNLQSETEYWFAIQAIDRWGNKSALSPVISGKTNAGPKVTIDKELLTLNVDVSREYISKDDLLMGNEGEGLLKWTGVVRKKNPGYIGFTAPLFSRSTSRIVAFNGKIRSSQPAVYSIAQSDYMMNDFPKSITQSSDGTYNIGDTDTTFSNSMAQYITVDAASFPEGFNLTHISIPGDQANGRFIVEVYGDAKNITSAPLLLSDTVSVSVGSDIAYSHDLYFKAGESFWVAIHAPHGNLNPLGIGTEKDMMQSDGCFFSTDMGNTWSLLADVLKASAMKDEAETSVWATVLTSSQPSLEGYITLSAVNGKISPNENAVLGIQTTQNDIIDGFYDFDLMLNTNETGHENRVVPISLSVNGHKPELHTAKVVNFGDLFVGQSKTIMAEVINSGYHEFIGEWGGSFLSESSDPQFKVNTSGSIFQFNARSKTYLDVKYTPINAGNHVATIKLTDANGIVHSFMVRGIAEEPAKIEVTPLNITIGDLTYGTPAQEQVIQIKNAGKYPLEYVFTQFSDDTLTNVKTTSHKFGYSYISNLNSSPDYTYEWNELPTSAANVQKEFVDDVYWSKPVEIGFEFPFYEERYSKIYIGSYGALSMTGGGIINVNIPPTASDVADIGIITAFGARSLGFDKQSKLLYANQNGKFVVSYENVLCPLFGDDYIRISFRIALCENGDIEMYYKDIEGIYEQDDWGMQKFPSGDLYIGCADVPNMDPFTITDLDLVEAGNTLKLQNNSAIKIVAPGRSMVQKIDYPSGIIGLDETKNVTLTIAADTNMYTGPLKNILTLLSTDPTQSTSYVTLEATIKGDFYKPFIELSTTNLDFGTNFQTSVLQEPVSIKNTGKASVNITALTLQYNTVQLANIQLPYDLKPGTSIDALITVPSDSKGSVEDVLTITADNGQTLTARIRAKIIGVPDMIITPGSVNVTLEGGTTKGSILEIANTGDEPLQFTIEPNPHFYPTDPTATQNEDAEYVSASSTNDENVIYDWIDITKTATEHYRIDYFAIHDYIKVALSEKITFYGKQYDTVYIFGNGFISFQAYPDGGGNLPTPPEEVPSPENSYISYIAPFWGLHGADQTSIGGVYYEQTENGFVVSYMDYGNSMNSGICFQTIINKEGVIKFQYMVLPFGQFMSLFGIAGIENEDHTKGIKLLERYVKGDKLAVEFYPVKVQTINPGENKKIGMVADARQLLKGTYDENLLINTNVPTHKEVQLLVNLDVTGKAKPSFPSSVNFEGVIIGDRKGYQDTIVVSNSGNAAFSIVDFKLKNASTDPYMDAIMLRAEQGGGGGVAPGSFTRLNPGEEIVVGKTPQKFIVELNMGILTSPQKLTDIVTFTTDLPNQSSVEIPVTANIVESPKMNVTQGNINFYASIDTMKFDSVFYLSNKEGKYKLDYTIDIQFSNVPAKAQTASKGVIGVMPTGTVAPQSHSTISPREEESEYKNELKYETIGKPINFLGSGDKHIPFSAITAYTAPANGFNIAAVECLTNITGIKSGEIKAEIKVGTSYQTAKTIGQGSLTVSEEENVYRTIVLDNPVYINPNETFFLFLTFPLGAEYPLAFIAAAEKNIGGRYFIYVNEEWVDLLRYESTYGPIALVVRCLEKEAGSPWISVLDPNNGSIAQDDSSRLTVLVNAATARFMKGNTATVRINSTAIDNPTHSFRVRLDKNYAPEITQISENIEISESDTTEVLFKVNDSEEDEFTVEVADSTGIASHMLTQNDLAVTLRTTFEQTGEQSFTIVATDEYQNKSRKTINYYVQKTNRAPIVTEPIQSMKVHLGDILEGLDLTQVFSDPDGDTLHYVVTSSDESIVKAFEKNNVLEFTQKTIGDVTITVTAYDPSELSAQTSFDFEVLNTQKASSGEKITAYPNPVIYMLNFRCSAEIKGDVTLRMYDMSGNIVYAEKTVLDGDMLKSLDMSSYPSGIYILEIEHQGGKTSTKVVKQ